MASTYDPITKSYTTTPDPLALEAERQRLATPQMNVPITGTDLTPTAPIIPPQQPIDNNPYQAITAGGQTALDTNTQNLAPGTTENKNAEDLFKTFLAGSAAPPSLTQGYEEAYKTTGIEGLNQGIL